MAGLIPGGESKSALLPSGRMIRNSCAILDGRDSIDPCFDAGRVFFASSIVTFNWEPFALRMPSIGTHTGSMSTIMAPGRFGCSLQLARVGRCGRARGPGNGSYDR
jgi:hypothetical protein